MMHGKAVDTVMNCHIRYTVSNEMAIFTSAGAQLDFEQDGCQKLANAE